jgi:FAD:protein FMN transferase
MATAFSVLQPEESRRIAASIPGAEFLLITSSGERIASAGWAGLALLPRVRTAAAFVSAAAPRPNAWDSSFDLTITIELASVGFFANRPYLAVWVEDETRKPVRTVALWYKKDRYLPEMHAWYRVAQSGSAQDAYSFAHSASSATRSPKKYTLIWDGRDDTGKPVAAGRYTIFIEAAREHGTYQLVRHSMDFNGVPGKVDLKGNTKSPESRLITTRSPLDSTAPVRRHPLWKRKLTSVSRWLHIYLSMVSFTIVLFFAATGFTLNHQDWFTRQQKTT